MDSHTLISFVEAKGFSYDEETPVDGKTLLSFSTRENGNVQDDEPGEEDIQNAITVKRELIDNFNDIEVEIETVDEFVYIQVTH